MESISRGGEEVMVQITCMKCGSRCDLQYSVNRETVCKVCYDKCNAIKPPLGVMPKYIWEEKRIQELSRATKEYSECGMINKTTAWVEELHELIHRHSCNQPNGLPPGTITYVDIKLPGW